jgi:hypothetical protein
MYIAQVVSCLQSLWKAIVLVCKNKIKTQNVLFTAISIVKQALVVCGQIILVLFLQENLKVYVKNSDAVDRKHGKVKLSF